MSYKDRLNLLNKSPYIKHLNDVQAAINKQWENSTQTLGEHTEVKAYTQIGIGRKEFKPVEISIDYMIDTSTGRKMSEDFKIFAHKNLSDTTSRGNMYYLLDNYWITIDTDSIVSPFKTMGVQRCNNIARWIDKDDGSLKEWHCIVSYDVSGTMPKYDKDVNVGNGRFVLIIQGNKDTLKITKNQRFIFNGEAYKVFGFNKMLQNGIVDDKTTLLYFDLYSDVIMDDDDLVNNIANTKNYNYSLEILNEISEQVQGYGSQFLYNISLDNNIVERTAKWGSNDNGVIDKDGNYALIGEVGSIAKFVCIFGDIIKIINIKIVDEVEDIYDIIISPELNNARQGMENEISVKLYKNGMPEQNNIVATLSGVDEKFYKWEVLGNNKFKLTNLYISDIPLNIDFSTDVFSKTISVNLISAF